MLKKNFYLKNIIWVWATPKKLGEQPILFPCELNKDFILVLDQNEKIPNTQENPLKSLVYYCTHYYNLNDRDLRIFTSKSLFLEYLSSSNQQNLLEGEKELLKINNCVNLPQFNNIINNRPVSYSILASHFRKNFYSVIENRLAENALNKPLSKSFNDEGLEF